jgi:hypothetical protein
MKTNEVRLGNLFKDKLTGAILEVDEIRRETVFFQTKSGPLPDGWEAGPIPLTPELLELCGFIRSNWVEHKGQKVFILREIFEIEIDKGKFFFEGWELKGTLHELQNLFFGLTGEELPINIKTLQNGYETQV